MTWSREDVDTGTKASIIQSYAILLSTLLSINRGQLSVCDAQYALGITSPPLMVYLFICSACDFCGIKTSLYKRIRSHRRVTRTLGVLIVLLWFALSLTLWLSRRAFVGSEEGGGQPFKQWLLFTLIYLFLMAAPGSIVPATPFIFVCFLLCLFRRRYQVMTDFRASRGGTPGLWGRLRSLFTFMGCAWYVPAVVGARLTKANAA